MLRLHRHNQTVEQLTSLASWWVNRGFATSADDALKYAKDRKSYNKELSELRKQWAAIEQERAAKQAAEQKASLERREALKAQRARTDAADRERALKALQERQAADRQLRASLFIFNGS